MVIINVIFAVGIVIITPVLMSYTCAFGRGIMRRGSMGMNFVSGTVIMMHGWMGWTCGFGRGIMRRGLTVKGIKGNLIR